MVAHICHLGYAQSVIVVQAGPGINRKPYLKKCLNPKGLRVEFLPRKHRAVSSSLSNTPSKKILIVWAANVNVLAQHERGLGFDLSRSQKRKRSITCNYIHLYT
jgi:hypothetical protein